MNRTIQFDGGGQEFSVLYTAKLLPTFKVLARVTATVGNRFSVVFVGDMSEK